jgi:hypothetical protein
MLSAMLASRRTGPAATGHRVHVAGWRQQAPGYFVRMTLGHLGHLGHGFKLHGHACPWVIWVIYFA